MNIYVAHSRDFDYEHELYTPLEQSTLASFHRFTFSHKNTSDTFNSRKLFESRKVELVIAEGSYPSIAEGIELGWANLLHISIMCIYKKGSKVSQSLSAVTQNIVEYKDSEDMIRQIDLFLKGYV